MASTWARSVSHSALHRGGEALKRCAALTGDAAISGHDALAEHAEPAVPRKRPEFVGCHGVYLSMLKMLPGTFMYSTSNKSSSRCDFAGAALGDDACA